MGRKRQSAGTKVKNVRLVYLDQENWDAFTDHCYDAYRQDLVKRSKLIVTAGYGFEI